jgi:hypothetical protein
MTARTIATDVDPTGLGGEQIINNSRGEHVQQMWAYPSHIALDAIRAAWLAAFPRDRHFTGVVEYRLSAGRRFVQVDRYDRQPTARPHIEEPPV